MGSFAQRGLAASSLNHCSYTGPHPSPRRHLASSFYLGWPYSATILFDPGCFTGDLWGLPGLAWLLHRGCQARCCL